MKYLKRNILAIALGALLIACIAAVWWTGQGTPSPADVRPAANTAAEVIDDRLLDTARLMSALAETAGEQGLSREALRLADHEFDIAYASALRDAAAPAPPPTGPLKQLADRISQIKARMARNRAAIDKRAKQAAGDEAAETNVELAKAQLALDEDELADAQEDLARQGGDRHALLERMLKQHEDAEHGAAPAKPPAPAATGTMSQQVIAWLGLRDTRQKLDGAARQAAAKTASLSREHNALDQIVRKQPPTVVPEVSADGDDSADDDEEAEDPVVMLARLHHLSDQRKTLAELDRRIQDAQQLAGLYKRWDALVATRQRAVLHLLLISLAGVLAVLCAVVAIDRGIRYMFLRHRDRRSVHQMRVMASIAVQVAGLLAILFIIFGLPNQTSTIIGLATAGLTVALKDFIVGFFGWFALMGKNGIRIGDWVEIEGVSGEVIEIGMLKTVLLELGNWGKTGRPTGRRVAFVNKFAIENHYFNFSTAGQWLWDELEMTLPDTAAAYDMARQIRDRVEQETAEDARVAEQDWERVTQKYGTRPFSAKPAVDLRPSANGLEVVVRYITRAPQRFEMKSRLLAAMVDLVHHSAAGAAH